MSWIGTSPSPLRSDRSSTALIAYSPFAEIRIGQRAVPGSARPGRRRASPNHRLALAGGATFIGAPRTAGPQPRDLLRLALPFIGSPRTAGPQPRALLRLALPFIGSPRTAGPQPRDLLRLALPRTTALQEPRRLAREVGDHHIGARPPDRDEGLQHGALLVEPPEPARRPDHRVLAGDRVAGQGHAELGLRARDDVQIRQRGLDHDDVRALVEVERDLAQSLQRVGRVHLVRAPVAELRRRVGGLPEDRKSTRLNSSH